MASAWTTWTGRLLSAEVRQRPSKTGAVVTQFVTQAGEDHVQRAVEHGEHPSRQARAAADELAGGVLIGVSALILVP